MRIRITDLPPQGITVTESIPLAVVNARVLEGTEDIGVSFVEPAPVCSVSIRPTATGAVATCQVTATCAQQCGRCAENKPRPIKATCELVVSYDPAPVSYEKSLEYSDLGVVHVAEGYADFDEDILQLLIQQIDLFWSPPLDNQQRCTLCGKGSQFDSTVKPAVRTLGDFMKDLK